MKESASKSVAYRSAKVLARGRFRDDLVVITREDRISSVQGADGPIDDGVQIIDLAGDYLLPGFIDTQVNGGGGVLFNDQPTVEGIRTIAEAHRARNAGPDNRRATLLVSTLGHTPAEVTGP